MGKEEINELVKLVPRFIEHSNIWTNYDEEADVLYIDFKKPGIADESEMTDDNIIVRYEKDEIIGITVLDAKKRNLK